MINIELVGFTDEGSVTPDRREPLFPVIAIPGSATPAVDSAPAVVSQPSSDAAEPAPQSTTSEAEKTLVAQPSTGAGSVSMMQPINAETYRRYRRARQNREAVVDGIAIAQKSPGLLSEGSLIPDLASRELESIVRFYDFFTMGL